MPGNRDKDLSFGEFRDLAPGEGDGAQNENEHPEEGAVGGEPLPGQTMGGVGPDALLNVMSDLSAGQLSGLVRALRANPPASSAFFNTVREAAGQGITSSPEGLSESLSAFSRDYTAVQEALADIGGVQGLATILASTLPQLEEALPGMKKLNGLVADMSEEEAEAAVEALKKFSTLVSKVSQMLSDASAALERAGWWGTIKNLRNLLEHNTSRFVLNLAHSSKETLVILSALFLNEKHLITVANYAIRLVLDTLTMVFLTLLFPVRFVIKVLWFFISNLQTFYRSL